MGLARLAENSIRKFKGKGEDEKLTPFEKILSSSIGGALATWNQPIEVVRVEMQSMAKSAERGEKKTILNTLSYIYKENGIKGLYRGVTPRIGLGIWQTVCMVSFADYVKAWCVLPSIVQRSMCSIRFVSTGLHASSLSSMGHASVSDCLMHLESQETYADYPVVIVTLRPIQCLCCLL